MANSVRQSVTIPGDLARQIDGAAKRRRETFSKSLLHYARRGIAEEQKTEQALRAVLRKIRAETSDSEAESYAAELTEIVFGPQRERRA
jgi:metal-responsive CopG/Arc/MetJ family transcriptional regulator